MISTPGAFHCAHMHWRWGAAAWTPKTWNSNPQFDPKVWPKGSDNNTGTTGMWGPLVDPAIWIQTINIAIVKNEPTLDPSRGASLSSLSTQKWETLFKPGLRANPIDISVGDDIVMWYASQIDQEVVLDSSNPLKPSSVMTAYHSASAGTVFMHGIFFAHDAEQSGGIFGVVGSTKAEYSPKDEAMIRTKPVDWVRNSGIY